MFLKALELVIASIVYMIMSSIFIVILYGLIVLFMDQIGIIEFWVFVNTHFQILIFISIVSVLEITVKFMQTYEPKGIEK